jgi:phosphate/sulfate permease
MILGFLLSLYSCVSNDIIQTLGTFLSSTKDKPVFTIWIFTASVLAITFIVGWLINGGDMAFGRLDKIPFIETFYWWHLLPPIILIFLTRKGVPVSTSFLILSIFSSSTVMSSMITKSILGYVLGFVASFVLYFLISRKVEKYFLYTRDEKVSKIWIIAKWCSTAFLWIAWLMQDAANLYVYLPRRLSFIEMILTVIVFMAFLWIVCYKRGGEIQKIVKLKTNTQDIRSATIIDIVYTLILFYFQQINNIPMSTTWVFVGVLAGREIAMYNRIRFETQKKVYKHIAKDLTKTVMGLMVSILVVFAIKNYPIILEAVREYLHF